MEKNILLIDDDPEELEIFTDALSRIAVLTRCSQVKTAKEAQAWLKINKPDFIFIDFDLPGVDGIKCLGKLKKMKELETTLFILYSNYVDEAMNKKALSMGATACIRKPYMTGLLATRLKEILLLAGKPIPNFGAK